jgi:glycosyltransferase involved in cell wall biosynthesis
LKALVGGLLTRPKVIAVIGATRADVERAVRHAQCGDSNLPIWAYCAEDVPAESAGPLAGCARFVSGGDALRFREDLRPVWPALSIIAWTGSRAPAALKLGAFFIPPFRVLVLNEAGDFFPATPAGIARHAIRRSRDVSVSHARRTADLTRSLAWRTGERVGDIFSWAWAVFLATLAAVARWTSPRANAAVMGSRQPAIQQKPAAGDRFVVVTIPNRGWPRRAVRRAVAGSDAEFVVLRGRDEPESATAVRSLVAAARETNAFAAARQAAHSAWRGRIVAKHPFRRLQPGEVSEVFAPFSSLLVLRRSTLSKLGVPRALTFGGALMILFWKASSAGLRSIAVGHDGAVTDEPAMELEDAELGRRLKLSPSLRALGPLRPARFRGNVAWSPAHSWALRGRPRVLVVSPYLPFPLSHGGAVRIYNICRALADRVDFVLACFREANENVDYERLHEVFREVYVVDQDEKGFDPAGLGDLPRQVAEYRNPAMADLVRTLCLEHRVDLVQLEYTQLAEYRDETGAVPVILVEHDITFTLYRQLYEADGKPETRREYDRWLEFEREALQCVNRVWTMSSDDRAEAISYGATERHAAVIPNGVDLERFRATPKPDGPPKVLFVGSFRHLPNLLAFEALRESIMPEVWRAIPDAILHVVAGPDHERAALLAGKKALLESDPRILIEGFVEDVRPAYSSADVVAVPLPLSAGTNIKVMEAMACARAVVSTPAGCRGLDLVDGRDLIVTDASFAGAIVELLRNEDLRMKIATEGRKTAERRFGWDAIAEDALRCYAALIGSTKHVERRLKLAAGVVVADRARDFDTPAV